MLTLPKELTVSANGVTQGHNGHLFISGGAHQVEHFLFGLRSPNAESFANFCANLQQRKSLCQAQGIGYAHMVCPDKQTIYREEYPWPDFINLGDVYRQHCPSTEFAYPVEALRAAKTQGEVYYRTDSHWNATGALMASQIALRALGLHAEAQALGTPFTDAVHSAPDIPGDLGSKLNPIRHSACPSYPSSMPVLMFDNQNTRNTGLMFLSLNPFAPAQRRLLVFGDSFLNNCRPFLATRFACMWFIRSPHLDAATVAAFKPSHVLTGNAERYLSHVSPDDAPDALRPLTHRNPHMGAGNPFNAVLAGVLTGDNTQLTPVIEQRLRAILSGDRAQQGIRLTRGFLKAGWSLSPTLVGYAQQIAQARGLPPIAQRT